MWAAIALLLVRGLVSVLSPPEAEGPAATEARPVADEAAEAFAIRFARAYLADPDAEALAPFMAEGARVGTGRPPKEESAEVAQAEVSSTEVAGDGESVLTVACELRDSRTLYLAVPIVRSRAGEFAALGAPWLVADPGGAVGVEVERPQPLVGPEALDIESLVSKFLPTYLASAEAGDLSYFLPPGIVIQPLGGQVALAALASIDQLGDGEGPHRTVLVGARVTDPTGGATYPLVYRLTVERSGRSDRWYVAAVQGVTA
jgi:Conjugative transposon protein TcpC